MSETHPLPGQYSGNTVQDHIDALRDTADLRTDGPLLDYLALAAADLIEKQQAEIGRLNTWALQLADNMANLQDERDQLRSEAAR